MIDQEQKEIKSSLQKELFLAGKQNFNIYKQDFISRHQQIIKGESLEKRKQNL